MRQDGKGYSGKSNASQTLSLISGCGQFRFEFTYTDC